MNFATLKALAIPEGNVTRITDASGRVLWKKGGAEENVEPVVLEVEKITADTYAGETTYTGEEFILLDIYPQPYATVSVTYGGLTKTITDTSGVENPNAQQVYFGTFNGVTDDVATPASGTLTIKGHVRGFGAGTYKAKSENSSEDLIKTETAYCSCITSVTSFGEVDHIPSYAFYSCKKLTSASIPENVTSISGYAFANCDYLTSVSIPEGVVSIGNYAFYYCRELTSVSIPESVTSIGEYAFYSCDKLTSISIPAGVTEIRERTFMYCNGLVKLTLHEGLTRIGAFAFFSCDKLNNVVIPASVEYLGVCSLVCYRGGEYDLISGKYYLLGTTPPEVATEEVGSSRYTPFNTGIVNASEFRIYVPKGCSDTYKNAWGILTNYIEEVS